MSLLEFVTLLRDLGLLGEAEALCAQSGATLAEVHGSGQMAHARAARRDVVEMLRARTRWSWRRLDQVFNRSGMGSTYGAASRRTPSPPR